MHIHARLKNSMKVISTEISISLNENSSFFLIGWISPVFSRLWFHSLQLCLHWTVSHYLFMRTVYLMISLRRHRDCEKNDVARGKIRWHISFAISLLIYFQLFKLLNALIFTAPASYLNLHRSFQLPLSRILVHFHNLISAFFKWICNWKYRTENFLSQLLASKFSILMNAKWT